MNQLEEHLYSQIVQLETLIKNAERQLKGTPRGSLRVSRSHNSTQYYWKDYNATGDEKYIKRKEEEVARQLAQKDYVHKLRNLALEKKEKLQACERACGMDDIEKFHEMLAVERQALITPLIMSDDENAEVWMLSKLKVKVAFDRYALDPDSGMVTDKGEVVRSKSEKILADKFYKLGIPYVYELAIDLPLGGRVIPDFTLLNKRTRRQFYWEHFGMMGEPDYSEHTVKKITQYQLNKIYQGKNLLMTYETSSQGLNIRAVDNLIREFLL